MSTKINLSFDETIERNLNCPLASAAYDLQQTENELTKVYDCIAAVNVLDAMGTDPDATDRYSMSLQAAARIFASMEPTMVEGNKTDEILDRLNSWADGIREERDSFAKACDELRLRSRGEAIKFIESELKDLDQITKKVDPNEKYFEGKATAYENVLHVLNTFKYDE